MTTPHHPHPRAHRTGLVLVIALAAFGLACRSSEHLQVADPAFDPTVRNPAAAEARLRVLVDEAHGNFHTAEGRYRPFADLLREDGFTVERGKTPFTADALADFDVLVIANAEPPEGDDRGAPGSAFTPAEVTTVERWVREGGSLLLIADHAPFGIAARELAAAFGVVLHDAHLRDPSHADPDVGSPYVLVFERSEGLIAPHPITRGRGPDEAVQRVVTFGGEALEAPAGATTLLRLADTAEIVDDPDRGPDRGPDPEVRSAAGMAHAVALGHGEGRVVVVGEAAVFTSQVLTGEVAESMGRDELRIGMSRTDTDNRQMALNTARWLGGLL